MRANVIGRWVGRATVFATVAVGFLAVTGAVASADVWQLTDLAVQSGFDWN